MKLLRKTIESGAHLQMKQSLLLYTPKSQPRREKRQVGLHQNINFFLQTILIRNEKKKKDSPPNGKTIVN